MATPLERDDIIASLITAVPALQTDVALVQRDIHYLTNQGQRNDQKLDEFARKQDAIIERLDKMTVVTPDQFLAYQNAINQRFSTGEDKTNQRIEKTEQYLADAKPGISLANALVSRWITLLVLLLTAAAMIVGFSKVLPIGN